MNNRWYNFSWNDVVTKLNSNSEYGLDNKNVEESEKIYGNNKFTDCSNELLISRLIKAYIVQPWAIITILIGIFFISNQNIIYGAVFIIFLITNFIIVMIESLEKLNKINTFNKLNDIKALVLRDGRVKNIPSENLVVGDIVYLETGKIIPADLRIIDSCDLKVKETNITAINISVEKYKAKIDDIDVSIGELTNMAFRTSVVTQGSGTGIVVAVGIKTQIGRIIKNIKSKNDDNMNYILSTFPMINKFVIISVICIFVLEVFSKIFLKHFVSISNMLPFVCFSPYEMVICLYFGFLLLRNNFNKEGIYFRNFNSLITFSEVNTLCVDKIGAFSINDTYVKRVYTSNDFAQMNENSAYMNDNLKRVITVSLLCSKCMYDETKDFYKGEIEDIAIVKFGLKNNIDKNALEGERKRIFEVPFDFARKTSVSVNRIGKKFRVNVKGPVERVLERCTHIMKDGVEREITYEDIMKIKEADIEMCGGLLATMALAYRNYNYKPSRDENVETYLVFTGIIGFENPLKSASINCIDDFKGEQIKPVIFTDDNKLTAQYFSKHFGLSENGSFILSGVELDNIHEDEKDKSICKVNVFSHLSSNQKANVIECLNENGCSICSVGNKFCDLEYMEISASQIATGETCNYVTRTLSDIYMVDYDYKSVLDIRKTVKKIVSTVYSVKSYIISCSIMLMIYNFLYYVILFEFPFNMLENISIIFLNILVSSILLICNYDNVKSVDKKLIGKYILFSIVFAFFGRLIEMFFNFSHYFGLDFVIIYIQCILLSICYVNKVKHIFKVPFILNLLNILFVILMFLFIK